jgi:phosphatidylglycerol---prolipoprotein diacylglyceryl transferase
MTMWWRFVGPHFNWCKTFDDVGLRAHLVLSSPFSTLGSGGAGSIHFVIEAASFWIGGLLYWRSRNRSATGMPAISRLGVLAGAALGAALGSRLLYVAQYWSALHQQPWQVWLGGKTIVGALLGGLIGVETAKVALGWRESTGDAFVVPLLVAIIVGRIGCQLSGVWDQTYGTETSLPWAWNYGDGIGRHPTALYEIVLLGGLAWFVRLPTFGAVLGDRFKAFMVGYLLLLLVLEFVKPPFGPAATGTLHPDSWGPFTAIQWACLLGLAYYFRDRRRWLTARSTLNA